MTSILDDNEEREKFFAKFNDSNYLLQQKIKRIQHKELRDQFALAYITANAGYSAWGNNMDCEELCHEAYKFANAMLVERDKCIKD